LQFSVAKCDLPTKHFEVEKTRVYITRHPGRAQRSGAGSTEIPPDAIHSPNLHHPMKGWHARQGQPALATDRVTQTALTSAAQSPAAASQNTLPMVPELATSTPTSAQMNVTA